VGKGEAVRVGSVRGSVGLAMGRRDVAVSVGKTAVGLFRGAVGVVTAHPTPIKITIKARSR
jgi:hypothetical protein